MSFLFPNLLFFLFALSIPIIIHLFNFRRYRKIEFTNVKLLRDIEITTKSTRNLKNLLILLSRLLAMAFLIFAFARPFIPAEQEAQGDSGNSIIIFIDNSFSMDDGTSGNSLLDVAKESASKLVNSYSSGKQYFLFTNSFNRRDVIALSKKEILVDIEKIEVSNFSKNFSEIENRINAIQSSNNSTLARVFIFSDFQKSQFNSLLNIKDSTLSFQVVLIEAEKSSNISIDSCWVLNPILTVEGIDTFYVSITNYSDEELLNQPVRLFVNEKQTSLNSVDLEPWSSVVLSIPHGNTEFGVFSCRLETADEGINQDDVLYFSYRMDSSINIYHIGGEETNRFFKAVYAKSFLYNHDDERSTDIRTLNKSRVFIVDGRSDLSQGLISEIQQNVRAGANLVLYPTNRDDLDNMNRILKSLKLESFRLYDSTDYSISRLNTNSPILRNTIEKLPENPIYPLTKGHFKLIEKVNIPKEDVLQLDNGDVALRKYEYGNGAVYLFCFGLSEKESNFTRHPLFVPVSINLAYTSRKAGNLYYYLDNDDLIKYRNDNDRDESVVHIVNHGIDIIPEVRRISNTSYLQLHNQISRAGNYQLISDNQLLDLVSLNFTRKESDIARHDALTLNELIQPDHAGQVEIISGNAREIASENYLSNKAKVLWKYCVILALIFFVAEVMIIKFIKV